MEANKHIDKLVIQKGQKEIELEEIHRAIYGSQKSAAIVIVDFVGSTALKENANDVDWLGRIYEFIQYISKTIQKVGGTLIKRMGDGLLISFTNVQSAEKFFENLKCDPVSENYPYKASADFGSVYYFRFEERLNDDPYGTPVDRCARLLEFARQGVILCSSDYVQASPDKDQFQSAGQFVLKGFSKPHEIFFRLEDSSKQIDLYFEPLIKKLNSETVHRPSYRYVDRKFSTDDFIMLKGESRPFLLRELLNIPKLPFSYLQFCNLIREIENKEQFNDYVGMMVEWEINFRFYSIYIDSVIVILRSDSLSIDVRVCLPLFMIDIIRSLKKNQLTRVRGIIFSVREYEIELNYADLDIVSSVSH